ncbi:MAG: glycosyl hydrolase [Bryobacteraceae bacterium]|jgi:uncharacterized protein (TIGR03437 family)
MRVIAPVIAAVLAVAAPLEGASTVQITVLNQKDTTAGQGGRLNTFLSTSFQPADWDYTFFQNHPANAAVLWQLVPQHINLQSIVGGNPQTGPDSWNFTENDAVNQTVLRVADHSPLYEIVPPPYLTASDGSVAASNFPAFAAYSANLARYFNAGGFNAGGVQFQSPTPYHITWWGIYNEPNGNGMTPQAYTSLYNLTVPAMQAVDPNLRFVAVELSDYTGQAASYMPTFVQNVNAQVDVVATHFYGTCNQRDEDWQLFATVGTFTSEISVIRSAMLKNAALASVPIWVTENNVNADYSGSNGMSVCNPGQVFVADPRGNSAFFAAWRPLVFERLAMAGVSSLHHWDHDADIQYGEVDYNTGATQFSYWVDYWLSHLFPSPPGADILQVQNQDYNNISVDAIAVRNDDGSVVVMLIDHALLTGTENNGTGDSRTFQLDVSALGQFASVTMITLDADTDPVAGPAVVTSPYMASLEATVPGYGVVLFKLNTTPASILPGGIVNAASFQAGPLTPGELVTIFGQGLGPSTLQTLQTSSPGFLDNFLVGTRVLFDGIPAPLVYAFQDYVSAVVPYSVAGAASTTVQVEYLGTASAPVTMPVAANATALFTVPPTGSGGGAIRDINSQLVSPANPVKAGDWISIYGTGEGKADPDAMDGRIASGPATSNIPVQVTIGGVSAVTSYAGRAPGDVFGVWQINAQIPQGAAPGPGVSNVPVQVKIGAVASQSGVTVAVTE